MSLPGRRPGRKAFTLVEVLIALLVLSILVRMGFHAYDRMMLQARASAVVGDLHEVRAAALDHHADHDSWPPGGEPGEVPEDLRPYLPEGFDFVRDGALLGWESWRLPDGLPGHPEVRSLVGLSVTPLGDRLGEAVTRLVDPTTAWYRLGDTYFFVLDGL